MFWWGFACGAGVVLALVIVALLLMGADTEGA